MRILAIILLLSTLLLTACGHTVRADDILAELCREYPIDRQIYSSLSDENDKGYIDSEMLRALYGISEYPVREFALVFYGKVDTVRDIGVFVIGRGEDVMEISELVARRISFLSSFSEGEGFIKKYKGALVYGFVESAADTEAIFDTIL